MLSSNPNMVEAKLVNLKNVLTCVQLLFVFVTNATSRVGFSDYVWVSDVWSDCHHASCGQGGQQTRSVACYPNHIIANFHNSTDLQHHAFPDSFCRQVSPKPATNRDCFRICDQHRHMYRWSVGQWSDCLLRPETLIPRPDVSNARPGNRRHPCSSEFGYRRRNVTCVSVCGGHVLPSTELCERFYPMPVTEETCETDCPRDCVTTDFGPAEGCETCWDRWKVRHRTVLLGPERGGRNCTDLREVLPCPEREECKEYRHTNYKFRIGPWSPCSAFYGGEKSHSRGFRSVLGQQRRSVECINVEGSTVERSFCSHTKKPSTGDLCVLHTPICSTLNVTEWTSYSQSMYASQSRDTTRNQSNNVRGSRGGSCNKSIETVAASDEKIFDCTKYRWEVGEWGRCVMQEASDGCGGGTENRTVLCVTASDQTPISDHHCLTTEPPVYTRTCTVACPQHCIVSEWSAWSECLPDSCRLERNKAKDGYRQRSRIILRINQDNGTICPHLHEFQPCEYPPCYTWKTLPSSECKLKYPDMQCGEGLRNRSSDCISILGGVVSSRLCFDPKPTHVEVCNVPCANDCVTSEWSEWSVCSKTCGVGRVVGYRTRFRDVLARNGSDGTPCPPVRMLHEKERCAETPCFSYYWQTSEWSKCRLADTPQCDGNQCQASTDKICGVGVQQRDVACYKNSGEQMSPKKCTSLTDEPAPPNVQNCSVPCPVGCEVSKFTEWSSCSVSCISDDTEFLPMQSRYRFVMRHPKDGALPCPTLIETRPCMNLIRCAKYRWHITDWSQCMFHSHADKCGSGFKAREVRCVNDRDESIPSEDCMIHLGPVPSVTVPCWVACDQDNCKFSDWSDWSACTHRCNGVQTRTRSMEGTTSRVADCYDRFKYAVEEQRTCSCSKLESKLIGFWSHCLLETGPTYSAFLQDFSIGQLQPGTGYCGVGRRSHALVCTNTAGQNLSATVCGNSEFMEEMCFVPCPRDCQLSPWTEWTACQTTDRCGNGQQSRSRYMIEPSLDGGRDCPPLEDGEEHQTMPCHVSCDQFQWRSEEWSVCTPTASSVSGTDCGAGLQSRIVRCLKISDDEEDQEVDDQLCDKLTRPFEINYCHMPCPGQCVVSIWSAWTSCQEGCVGNSRRRRTRVTVRHPARGSGALCPHPEEFERCDSGGASCFSYSWKWSNWSLCLPFGGMTCGNGRRIRFRECVRSDGIVVSRGYCPKLNETIGTPSHESSEVSCTIQCPVDCVVSGWSAWLPCSHTCGLGTQSRSRSVVIHTQHRGRHCPEPLIQQRYCAFQECFRWQLSEWSQCHLESNSCGYGVQTRNLSCIGTDSIKVDEGLCDFTIKSDIKLTQECLQPCPNDCLVSDWSPWGPCHRPCDGLQTRGRQTRSRLVLVDPQDTGAACPEDLIETRECSNGGYCPTYNWHTSYWASESRYVWCQRSDGLIVYGACKEYSRPYTVRGCNPPCTGSNTLCVNGDSCICERGFEKVFIEGRLVKCEKIQAHKSQAEEVHGTTWLYVILAASSIVLLVIFLIIFTVGRLLRREKQNDPIVEVYTDERLEKSRHLMNGGLNPPQHHSGSNPLNPNVGLNPPHSHAGLNVSQQSDIYPELLAGRQCIIRANLTGCHPVVARPAHTNDCSFHVRTMTGARVMDVHQTDGHCH